MHAAILRDFLMGGTRPETLVADLQQVWRWRAPDVRELRMEDLDEDFEVTAAHLVRLCDAVLAGDLPPALLEPVAVAIDASDHFFWDGDTVDGRRVAETVSNWSTPEVNFALTETTVRKFRHRLLTGENEFTRADHFRGPASPPRSIWTDHD